MFRPDPEQTVFGHFPIRMIVSMILILAVVLTIVLFLEFEHARLLLESLSRGGSPPGGQNPALLHSRAYLVKMTLIIFLVSGIGITALLMYQGYQSTRMTLQRVKSLARNILHSIPSGILTVDEHGRITAINPSAERLLGLRAEDDLGRPLEKVFREDDPVCTGLYEALTANRLIRNLDISYPEGVSRRIRLTTSELMDPAHAKSGIVLLVQDVTDLLLLEEQLRRSEKLSALHTLSAGVAHEIRNPLSALDLNLHLLRDEFAAEKPQAAVIERYLDILTVEIQRIKEIMDNFARFAKPSPLLLGEVKLQTVLEHIAGLLRYEAGENQVEIILDVPDALPPVLGDETQLSQVFLNFMINAIQAMPHGGRLTVAARTVGESSSMVEVLFSDTGIGISTQDLPKLFEPFFSTKPEGLGLGLAIAYRIIQDHRGEIRASSHEGIGTTLSVRLPAQTTAAP